MFLVKSSSQDIFLINRQEVWENWRQNQTKEVLEDTAAENFIIDTKMDTFVFDGEFNDDINIIDLFLFEKSCLTKCLGIVTEDSIFYKKILLKDSGRIDLEKKNEVHTLFQYDQLIGYKNNVNKIKAIKYTNKVLYLHLIQNDSENQTNNSKNYNESIFSVKLEKLDINESETYLDEHANEVDKPVKILEQKMINIKFPITDFQPSNVDPDKVFFYFENKLYMGHFKPSSIQKLTKKKSRKSDILLPYEMIIENKMNILRVQFCKKMKSAFMLEKPNCIALFDLETKEKKMVYNMKKSKVIDFIWQIEEKMLIV